MLTLLFLICLGQLLAIGVHAGTWWLRERHLDLAACFGSLVFALALFWFMVLWFADGSIDIAARTDSALEAVAARERLDSLLFIAAFCAVIGALGLYHSFLLKRDLSWRRWLKATMAIWFEIGISIWLGASLLAYSELRLSQSSDNTFFPPATFAMTLLALALFRPVALKVAREMYSIRSKRVRRA